MTKATVVITGDVTVISPASSPLYWDGLGWSAYSPNDKIIVSKPSTTYQYRDPEKRREYLKDYMRKWRARQKEKRG